MTQRLIAIGDIHGCRTALETLLDAVQPSAEDTVVTLGDYIDRGPDSRGVIETLIRLGERTQLVGVLGNHEEMMLEVLHHGGSHHAWLRYGGVETLESYGFDGDLDFLPPEHQQFLDALGDFYVAGDFFFTHAAYNPEVALEDQEIELLRWYSLTNGIPTQHQSGKTAVVGHTANRDGEILDTGHLICLDTYCYGGGWLTAMDVNTRQVWQANEQGELRQ
ncbi:Serine/threonine-protein phosphatase 1 [Stieleria maiorica]|uniref:Serine/threonine-protein phosphatase 1 n=1 Tax=Stieleria maiorica TaxID=2795974 RepID=A0A5B9MIK5_9BACT|nr:metallophosphoesterase family protein [Stieleria maiorica]QEF98857.1 Serine/threonine-protein phosphatase 1 [Stieleria maiorica]